MSEKSRNWINKHESWWNESITREISFDSLERILDDYERELHWVSTDDKILILKEKVLVCYLHNGKQILTEGYITDRAKDLSTSEHPEEFWRSCGRGLTWFDALHRQIQSLTAKKSKNKVTHWMPMICKPK